MRACRVCVELAAENPRGVRREATSDRAAREGREKDLRWNALRRDWLETYSGKHRIAYDFDLSTSASPERKRNIRKRKSWFYRSDATLLRASNALLCSSPYYVRKVIQKRDFYNEPHAALGCAKFVANL